MAKKWYGRIAVVIAIVLAVVVYQKLSLSQYLSLESLKQHQGELEALYRDNPAYLILLYVLVYVSSTALSLPGATILTLAGGALFGFWTGTLIVSFASTIGATLAFLVSRFVLRDSVQARFKDKLVSINKGIERDGSFFLLTLRLVPIFPFFLVNLVMGVTPLRVGTFFIVSQIGMLPGTAAYVNAGTQLVHITSLHGILSPSLLLSFALIGVLPLISKMIVRSLSARKHMRRFKRPKHFDYNMVVLGGGSAGLVSAYIASAVKAKVALIEKHKMGGDCLNTGCVPSKALIRSAKIFNYVKRAGEFGLEVTNARVNFKSVMDRIQHVIAEIEPHDSVERYQNLGVECLKGEAFLRSPFEVEVNGRVLTTRNIVIATGARPLVPPLEGLDQIKFKTSENLWEMEELPENLVILGGGPIGCELAQSFARLGSKVTILEMSPRLLSREDADVSELITATFAKEGILVRTSHRAVRVDAANKVLVCEHNGITLDVPFDELLLALGRQPNVTGFGLEQLGVELTPKKSIAVDSQMRTTNFPNIFACGDVAGPYQFTHVAAHQAWYVAVNALFSSLRSFNVDYRVIPWCTFTDPEVARVGLNEQDAREQNIAFEVTSYNIDDLDRAIAESEAHGFVKVLTPPGSDKILGVTIVGAHAGEILAEYVTAMKYGLGMNKILGTIHVYPTFAEANKYAAGVWKRNHAPQSALKWLARFHAWRR